MAKAKKKETKSKTSHPDIEPLVDTHLAAQAAAKRVVAGVGPTKSQAANPLAQSASFKLMKENLNKPSGGLAECLIKRLARCRSRPTLHFMAENKPVETKCLVRM